MMKVAAIELNNASVGELKRGNVSSAFGLLWSASKSVAAPGKYDCHVDAAPYPYYFSWENITVAELIPPAANITGNEGCMDLLSLRFVTVHPNNDHSIDEVKMMCSCGFSWVIWYNLGIVCTVLGTRLGGVAGRGLLNSGFQLLETAQWRLDVEPPSEHWTRLQLSVLVNQACINREFHMTDEMQTRLCNMASILISASSIIDPKDWIHFYFTLQALSENTIAPAA